MRKLLLALLFLLPWSAGAQNLPYPINQMAIPEQASANGVSNYVFLNAALAASTNAKNLVSLTVVTGASAGFVMVFDATALPSNGAVTPKWCVPVAANSYIAAQWTAPVGMTNGVVAAMSTGANCDTLTASATAKFIGQAF